MRRRSRDRNARRRARDEADGIPGLAVGVTVDGLEYVFTYGVASKATRLSVEASTLFEIGSIIKTFTATLASYAHVTKRLSLDDETSAGVTRFALRSDPSRQPRYAYGRLSSASVPGRRRYEPGRATLLPVPETRATDVVLLANKSYPIDARVTTAYRILTHLKTVR
jgi:hypothetical protein